MSPFAQLILDPLLWRDRALSQKVSRWRPPRWVRIWMVCASRGGDGGLWCAAAVGLVCFGGPRRWLALAGALLAAAVAVGSFTVIKRMARRSRPARAIPHCWAAVPAADEFSFPSGHALTAFAIATALLGWYPALAPLLLFCAVSVAASRLVLGLHFLTDILAGGALGVLLGHVSALAFLR